MNSMPRTSNNTLTATNGFQAQVRNDSIPAQSVVSPKSVSQEANLVNGTKAWADKQTLESNIVAKEVQIDLSRMIARKDADIA